MIPALLSFYKKITFSVMSLLLRYVALVTAVTPTDTKKYRDDYEYNRHTDAFYKFHTESDLRRKPWRLKATCEVEGAELVSAMSQEDISQVHAMFKRYPDIGDYVYIASDGLHHDSAEEQQILDMGSDSADETETSSEVLTRAGTVETISRVLNLPFVCKVKAKDVPYNPRCGVHARGYRYYSSVNSCYRIPQISYTWYQAAAECQAEGAHLAVVNSDTERMVLQNITALDGRVPDSWNRGYFLIGFRAEKTTENAPRVFKTIFNQTLEDAGFCEWSATEPNNLGGRENCGSVFRDDGKLNDISCSGLFAFICEKEVLTNP